MIVHVYRNIHKSCWSIRHKGKVIAHKKEVTLLDASFHVQPAGLEKARSTRQKNVHAYIKGELSMDVIEGDGPEITYNPYGLGYFHIKSKSDKLTKVKKAHLTQNGQVFIEE